jgi:hypothetical protein
VSARIDTLLRCVSAGLSRKRVAKTYASTGANAARDVQTDAGAKAKGRGRPSASMCKHVRRARGGRTRERQSRRGVGGERGTGQEEHVEARCCAGLTRDALSSIKLAPHPHLVARRLSPRRDRPASPISLPLSLSLSLSLSPLALLCWFDRPLSTLPTSTRRPSPLASLSAPPSLSVSTAPHSALFASANRLSSAHSLHITLVDASGKVIGPGVIRTTTSLRTSSRPGVIHAR